MKKHRPLSRADLADRVSGLRGARLFDEARVEDLEKLAHSVVMREVPPGREVVREGYLPSHVYVIKEGEFDVVSRGEEGEEPQVVNTLGPGDHFGEIGLIEGMPATATVRARTPATLYEVAGQAFLAWLDEAADIAPLADRVSEWLARTHPSYRPSVGVSPSGEAASGLESAIADLSDEELRVLVTALERVKTLDRDERLARLRRLGS